MKVAELLNEDWGSSDWYPIMQAIKKSMADGMSLEDAAADQADRYYMDMGYDNADDAAMQIIRIFNLRNKS